MNEPVLTESRLFELYEAIFEMLMKCLLVSVAVLFVATIILIFLCCLEETRKNRPLRMGIRPEADSNSVPAPLRSPRFKFHPWLRWARLLPWMCLGPLAWPFKASVAFGSESMSEKTVWGSTGYQPVPSGNLPDGTVAASINNPGAGFITTPIAVPVGKLPTGAGRLPAPPISQTGSEPPQHRMPLGLDEFIPVPEDNPSTPEKIVLGRQLFFDKRLSRDGTVACATCHIPERAFADGRRIAVGIEGRAGRRNVPSLLNRAYGRAFFWDGRAKALEEQPLEAILNPKEMDLSLEELGKRLTELNGGKNYRGRLQEVFLEELASISNTNIATKQKRLTADFSDGHGSAKNEIREISVIHGQNLQELDRASQRAVANAAKAIAAYVRSLLSGNSAFDRYEHGDQSALSEAAKRGLQIFRGKGNCIACHSGPLLSDEDFHNTGLGWGKEPHDYGRSEITHREQDRGKFKVPTLRNVALTAPYMHDGSITTLEDAAEFYSKGGNPNPNLDREIHPLNLSREEKTDLVTFLQCLSGEPLIQTESR